MTLHSLSRNEVGHTIYLMWEGSQPNSLSDNLADC